MKASGKGLVGYALLVFVIGSILLLSMAPAQGAPPRLTGPGALPAAGPTDAATLTMQFNNRQSTVLNAKKKQAILEALANSVFLVPVQNVELVGSINQSGLLSRQSVVTFRAHGPTTNRKTVLDNCRTNTRRGLIRASKARRAIKKATDTWWPRDAVRVQKASCAPATAAAGK